ncbi:MAG: thioredoxin family protein [Tagaea sp.]|nr:thioredoxin family protein [Tagaea sp.]
MTAVTAIGRKEVFGNLAQLIGIVAFAFGLLSATQFAAAAESAWVRHAEVSMRLVSASATSGNGKDIRLGLEVSLSPGWKTYWRSPGDAGFAPRLDWRDSINLASTETLFPLPERFTLFGLETFGYGDRVILPISIVARGPGPLRAALNAEILICEKICIPYAGDFTVDLPAGSATPSSHAHEIARFESRVPPEDVSGAGANGLQIEGAGFRSGERAALVVRVRSEIPFEAPDVFVEGADGWSFARPSVARAEGGRYAIMTLAATGTASASALDGRATRLTLSDGHRAVERTLYLGAAPASLPIASDIWLVLAIAVLGGLILNLMPCVLPVLAMKLSEVTRVSGGARSSVRRSFLWSAAGIVTSFIVLAAVLITLKAAGWAVGWGFHFQSPFFLAAMATIVTIFAANLWGWFEVPLPRLLADRAERASGSGAFATGAFAGLLSTPCSAPFVGTAVGFALSRGPAEIVAIFAALGFGLAIPYIMIASFPGLVRALPRSGPWIGRLRATLGLALFATAAWLVWVVMRGAGDSAAFALSIVLGALLACLYALRRSRGVTVRTIVVLLAIMLAVVIPARLVDAPGNQVRREADVAWVRFERDAIDVAVRQGRVVFVDVTADWCVSCQFNKRMVLDRGEVAKVLAAGEVLTMRADWTTPDSRIAAYLMEFGRYGIPFNAVYGPNAPGGLPLPELLTERAVLEAFSVAWGPRQ